MNRLVKSFACMLLNLLNYADLFLINRIMHTNNKHQANKSTPP